MWQWEMLAALAAVGCAAGLIAGLLGIGGGLLIVPIVVYLLKSQGVAPGYIQHIAVGTSFAVMVFTSFSSALAHHRHGAVRWDMFAKIAPGVVAGTLAGSFVSAWIPEKGLQGIFVVFVYYMVVKTLRGAAAKEEKNTEKNLPAGFILAAGLIIGLLSSWIGIGGGTLSVPFMLFCGIAMRQCVGTSAALGWPIAFCGALTYWLTGLQAADLPAHTAGFIYLPALAVLAVCTIVFAPLGAKLGNSVPPRVLKILFAVLLMVIAGQMTYHLLAG